MSELPGKITIYEPKMAKEVAELFNSFNEIWPGGFGGAIPYDETRIHDWLDKTSAVADLIALDEKEVPVGYCGLYPHWRDEKAAYINILGVHPKVLGKKFGKRLLLESLEVAKENGITRVDLHTWSGNMEAVPLYKKVGLFWVPETSVYMQDFIPGILQFPLSKDWFEKHPDWYSNFKRELTQIPDKISIENMELYPYNFEVGEDKLLIEIDRYGWGISGVEKQLNGDKLSIKTRLESHEIFIGIKNSMTINITNGTSNEITTPILVESFKGLNWIEEFPKEITISSGESITLTKEFVVSKEAEVYKSNQRGSKVIRTKLRFDKLDFELITGGKIQEAVKLFSQSYFHNAPIGRETIVFLDLYNNTDFEFTGKINYKIEGLSVEEQTMEFSLKPEEISGIEIPVTVPIERENSTFTISAIPIVQVNGSFFEMPEYKFPIVADATDLTEVIISPDPERIYLLTDHLQIRVELEGGNIYMGRRNFEERSERATFEIGPPYGLDLDRTLKYSFKKVIEGNNTTLVLSGESRQVKGLKIEKFIKVTPGVREIEHWINLSNITDDKTIAAGGKIITGFGGGLSLSSYGNFSETITPVSQRYIRCDPTLPILGETLVSQTPEDWQESWTAGKLIGESRYSSIFWKPDNVSKIVLRNGYLNDLESKTTMLEPKATTELFHLWFGDSYVSLHDIRNRWSQLISHKELARKERVLGVKTTEVIECALAESNVVEIGVTKKLKVEFKFVTAYPFPGTLSLSLPDKWEGHFVTEEGNLPNIPMPQPIPLIPMPLEIELVIPIDIKQSCEIVKINFNGEFKIDFDIPLILIGKEPIEIRESQLEGEKVWSINNNSIQFLVTEKIGGNLIRLKDSQERDFFIDNFPNIQPYFFIEHYLGGIQPLVFTDRDENILSELEEATTTELVEEGKWKGVKSSWIIKKAEHLKGQEYSVTFLTLPKSNLIRIRIEHNNKSSRRIQAIAAFLSNVALENDQTDNIITVPGGTKTWTRNRIQKPFQNVSNVDEPWARISKGNQSVTYLVPNGFMGANTILDAQMAIFHFMTTFLETKPKEKSAEEFLIIVNESVDVIDILSKALGKR